MILAEKFYLFDVGVANFLINRRPQIGSPEFGKSFEHYILMELRAYQGYEAPDLDLTYWRTSAGQEIDFIFGDKQLAVEIKGTSRVHEGDLKNFKVLLEDGPVKKCIVVCLEKQPRMMENKIEVLPWKIFLDRLWKHEFLSV